MTANEEKRMIVGLDIGTSKVVAVVGEVVVDAAEIIVGGERHHNLSTEITAQRMSWPSPFDTLMERLKELKGKRVVVLETGDPLWYSVGSRIGREIDPSEISILKPWKEV